MKFSSQYKVHEIIRILHEEVDEFPSFFRSIIMLNANYFSGTSSVCGAITDSGFELRNRRGPSFKGN
jgi:hypothetical protein